MRERQRKGARERQGTRGGEGVRSQPVRARAPLTRVRTRPVPSVLTRSDIEHVLHLSDVGFSHVSMGSYDRENWRGGESDADGGFSVVNERNLF